MYVVFNCFLGVFILVTCNFVLFFGDFSSSMGYG